MFLFLDFDGVLHSNYGRDCALWGYLPRLESVLRDFPETRLVVSSSWGDGRSMEELRAFFSPDIASRVVDKVRTPGRRMTPTGERGDACQRFCRRHRLRAGDWVAIDDNSNLFRKQHPLIRCINGFREQQEFLLRLVLANEIPAWRFAIEVVEELYDLEFDLDAQRTREYVRTHRPDQGDGRTIAELLVARRRRSLEKHLYFLSCLRPQSGRRTPEEMIERYGYAPEQLSHLWWGKR